ncbi:MAG: hypothetical protein U5L06_03195 [Rhodovibrio sp.]|nr:hypothetical protein [Rhodovibrio sp.]
MARRVDTRQSCFDTLSCGQLLSMKLKVNIGKTIQLHPEQAAFAAVSKDD